MQISVKEAMAMLNASESALYRWIDHSEIPFYKINDTYWFNRSELLEWATSRGMSVSPDMFAEKDDESVELPLLADALRAGSVLYEIEGSTNAEVLKSIVDHLVLPPEADRGYLFQILVAREALGSTGIGNGIAIPHVRNPVVLHVAEPSVTLCFLKKPIDFKALDGIPVSILFTIISPTVRSHLHLLSRIAFILRDPKVTAVLARRGSPQEILAEIAAAESRIPEA